MSETAEPWYPIPPDPEHESECACGGRCDCNDQAEDVSLAQAESSPGDTPSVPGPDTRRKP